MRPRSDLGKRHQIMTYFVLAYVITWILVSPLVLSGQRLTPAQFSPDLHMLGALGPLAAAFIVTILVAGRGGAQRLLARMAHDALVRVGSSSLCSIRSCCSASV
jgi:hypothetical protein